MATDPAPTSDRDPLRPAAWTAGVRAAWPPVAAVVVAAVLCFAVLPHVN